jgi:hypothetical protein
LLKDHHVRYAGARFRERMTLLRVETDQLLLHSVCDIDEATAARIGNLGQVAKVVAPGSFHHFQLAPCQPAFPNAGTHICPGIEGTRPCLTFNVVKILERILAWDFERVVIAHGDSIERDTRAILREAWQKPLSR